MLLSKKIGRIAVCILVCTLSAAQAYAASGRSLAIGRAFSYGYNNPQQEVGSGPLASSMYYGGPPVGSSGAGGNAYGGPLDMSARSSNSYTPMVPMTVSGSSGSATLAPAAGSGSNPVREAISLLAWKDREGFSLDAPPLTSLAPVSLGAVRDAILRGETLFKAGKYEDAVGAFEGARTISKDMPEALLSLAQVYFATKQYDKSADCLDKVLKKLPGLMQVRVRPKDFFGNADEYKKAAEAVAAAVKADPKNSAASMILAYIQYREGQMDEALATIEAAMSAGPAKDIEDNLAALYQGILKTGQVFAKDAPEMGKAAAYAWAGINVGFPKGFVSLPLAWPNQVVTGVIDYGKDAEPGELSLYAYPMGDGNLTLKAFMDSMMDSMKKSPAVKDMTTEAEAEVPFKNGTALVRLFNFTSGGKKTHMGWVAFIREPAGKKGAKLVYLLGLSAGEKQADKLLPTLGAIGKTIAVSEAVSPDPTKVDTQGQSIEDKQYGIAVTLPGGWAGRPTNRGFEMGQMDFAKGDCVSPRVEFIVQTVPADMTPKKLIDEAVQRKAPAGLVRKVLSQSDSAKLAGMDGCQVVASQTPEEGGKGPSSILVGRIVMTDKDETHKKLIAMVVECRDAQAKDVEALADKIAANLQLLK